jgi:hypothetical protein
MRRLRDRVDDAEAKYHDAQKTLAFSETVRCDIEKALKDERAAHKARADLAYKRECLLDADLTRVRHERDEAKLALERVQANARGWEAAARRAEVTLVWIIQREHDLVGDIAECPKCSGSSPAPDASKEGR